MALTSLIVKGSQHSLNFGEVALTWLMKEGGQCYLNSLERWVDSSAVKIGGNRHFPGI